MKDANPLIKKETFENQNNLEKGPLSFVTGSLASFLLSIFFYFIQNFTKFIDFLTYFVQIL